MMSMLKKGSLFPIVLVVVGALSACGGTVTFDVPLDAETEVQGAGILGGVLSGLPGFDGLTGFDVAATQEFENNNAEKDRVTEAQLSTFGLAVTAPSGATLDFLDEIAFYVESPGEERVRVAQKTIPDGATSVELDLDDQDLAAYVRADSMTFTTEVSGSQPEDDTTLQADAVLTITAEVVSGL